MSEFSKECNSWTLRLSCGDRQNLLHVLLLSVCPAGGGPSESTQAAHQTAEGSTKEASAERRSQLGDEIQERKPEHNQIER